MHVKKKPQRSLSIYYNIDETLFDLILDMILSGRELRDQVLSLSLGLLEATRESFTLFYIFSSRSKELLVWPAAYVTVASSSFCLARTDECSISHIVIRNTVRRKPRQERLPTSRRRTVVGGCGVDLSDPLLVTSNYILYIAIGIPSERARRLVPGENCKSLSPVASCTLRA